MKRLLLLAACALSPAAFAQAVDAPDDRKAIEQVIETFRSAIIAKDGAALRALPANGGITFIGVPDAAAFARIRAKHPEAQRISAMDYGKFVDFITSSADHEEEKFSNVRIDSDGTVASVYFDYSFSVAGKITNRGHETWGLVNSGEGWKISSVIWSITLPESQ